MFVLFSLQGKEGEIVAAIKEQRSHLTEDSNFYSQEEVFIAPISLLHEHTRRVTDTSGDKSLVKKIIIGKVPDRGGRANEMRPKAEKQFFGGRGGSGGGGGGGSGRSGGGRSREYKGRGGPRGKGGGRGDNGDSGKESGRTVTFVSKESDGGIKKRSKSSGSG